MKQFKPSLYFTYLAKHYLKNLLVILFGLSLIFSVIDYFQHSQILEELGSYQLFYLFYRWEESLTILYPLSMVFALIVTKSVMIKNTNMVVLHAFGYHNKELIKPFIIVASGIYLTFFALHMTEFSYASEKAEHLLKNEYKEYQIQDLFFKYNDTFVYLKQLDPVKKEIKNLTIFKVEDNKVSYTIKAPYAVFDGEGWDAREAVVKTHKYKNGVLQYFSIEQKETIRTLEGYKPKIIESLYEGKALNMIDAYHTWKLFVTQHIDSTKVRSTLYDKIITPLFAIAMVLILFFKLPFHARTTNLSLHIIIAVSVTLTVWGVLIGLGRLGYNGVMMPEFSSIVPVGILVVYALYIYRFEKLFSAGERGSSKAKGASN